MSNLRSAWLLMLWRGSVSLPAIFEPIADLRQREARFLGQSSFLVGRRVAILFVTVFERLPGLFLEAVDCLLAVPDRFRKGVFPS